MNPATLTPWEAKILRLIRSGLKQREVAEMMGIKVYPNGTSGVGPAASVAAEKERALALDYRPKSHAPTSPRAAHGNNLEEFIR